MTDVQRIRQLLDAGAFDEALGMLGDAAARDPEAALLVAEVHERRGDMLWFHDRPGSGAPYRAAMQTLLTAASSARNATEAARHQDSWSRIAEKVLHGTGPDGRRRPGATGSPHPHGDPPQRPPAEPLPREQKPVEKPRQAAAPVAPASTTPPAHAQQPAPEPAIGAKPRDTMATADESTAGGATPTVAARHPEDRGPLRVGHRFRVLRSFRDFDGDPWEAGTEFVYEGSSYWPRDEGFVFFTDRGGIRLCGLSSADSEILDHLDAWFAPVDP